MYTHTESNIYIDPLYIGYCVAVTYHYKSANHQMSAHISDSEKSYCMHVSTGCVRVCVSMRVCV